MNALLLRHREESPTSEHIYLRERSDWELFVRGRMHDATVQMPVRVKATGKGNVHSKGSMPSGTRYFERKCGTAHMTRPQSWLPAVTALCLRGGSSGRELGDETNLGLLFPLLRFPLFFSLYVWMEGRFIFSFHYLY